MIRRLPVPIFRLGGCGDFPITVHSWPAGCVFLSNLLKLPSNSVAKLDSPQPGNSGCWLLKSRIANGAGEMQVTSPRSVFHHQYQALEAYASAKDASRGSRACSLQSNAGQGRTIRRVHLQAWQQAGSDHNASSDQKGAASQASGLKGFSKPISLRELKRQKEAQWSSDGAEEARRQRVARDPVALQHTRDEPGPNELDEDDVKSPQRKTKQTLSDDKDGSIKGVSRGGQDSRKTIAHVSPWNSNTKILQVEKADSMNSPKQATTKFLTVEDFLKGEAAKKRREGIQDEDNIALSVLESFGSDQTAAVQDQNTKRRAQQRNQQNRNVAPWKVKYDEAAALESKEPDLVEVDEAKEKAIVLLNQRHKSASELRNKLTQYGFAANAVKAAVERVQEVGLQNDLEYAEAFARVRWQGFRWGPDRVKRELRLKGVEATDVEKGISAVYGERAYNLRVSADQESSGGEVGYDVVDEDDVSGCIERELYIAAKRHYLSGSGQDVNKRWKKTADWLARRGFNWATASSIMTALKAEPGVWV